MRQLLQSLRQRLRLLNRQRLLRRQARRGPSYAQWVQSHDTLGPAEQQALTARLQALEQRPTIAVLMRAHGLSAQALRRSLDAVKAQWYPHWSLLVAIEDGSDSACLAVLAGAVAADSRIAPVEAAPSEGQAAASNRALERVQAPVVAVLAPGALLREHALLMMAEALQHRPGVELVYGDEDLLRDDGTLESPFFKPDWDPELLLSRPYLGALVAYRTQALRHLGGFRTTHEGAHDHDLALRVTQDLAPDQVVHVPHVLSHATAAAETNRAQDPCPGVGAVQSHLERLGVRAEIRATKQGWFSLRAQAPRSTPAVTLIVPTRDGRLTLPRCYQSLVERTTYPNWRLLVVDNGSVDAGFLRILSQIAENPRCSVLRDDRPFNYSALNNRAVAAVDSEYVLLLNDDTEVVSPDWLDQLLGWAALPGVGAVGARLWYGNQTLQHAGVVLGIGDVAGHLHRHLSGHEPGYQGRAALLQDFSALTGACLLVSRAHYLAVGGLDETQLGVAYNDVDFCLKLRQRGLRNVFVPTAELMHHESISRGNDRQASKRQRMLREAAVMTERWGHLLARDPAYNPNLSLADERCGLASPPRVDLRAAWFQPPR
jgi:GT2 family glycosyltransferase